MRHIDLSDRRRQCFIRYNPCDFIVTEVYFVNRSELEQLSREVSNLIVAEVDFFDALAVLERRRQGFNFVVLEDYYAKMGQFLEEVILELTDLVVLHIEVMQTMLLLQSFWQAFQAHFLEDQLLHELQSA